MSAENNKANARRYFEEVWNQRNLSVIDEITDPNYTDHDPANPDLGRGPESVRKLVNMYLSAFPDTHFTIEEMIAEGDRVVTRWTVRGTHKGELKGIPPSNKRVTLTGTSITRFVNGKAIESHTNWDALGLFQQIGTFPGEQARGKAAR